MGRRRKADVLADGPAYDGPLGTVPKEEWDEWARVYADMSVLRRKEVQTRDPAKYEVMVCADRRARARASFWTFMVEVMENPVLYEPLHKPLCEWLEPGAWTTQKKMLLMARGHVKSNVFTVGYVLWRICLDANERILLASHRDEDVNKFIVAIGNKILYSPRFKETFPDIRPALGANMKPRRWSEWRIEVERTTDYIEPTVQGTTPNKSASGQHYSLLVPDDIVTHLNVKSETQLETTKEFHEQCESLLDPGAQELMIGTRYHFEDEYGRIQDTTELAELYDVKVIPATHDPLIVDEYISGRMQWRREHDFEHCAYPSRFTLDKKDYVSPDGDKNKNRKSLPQVKVAQGSLVYANQYQLVPRDPKTQPFDIEHIEIVDELPQVHNWQQRYEFYQFLDHSSEKDTQSKTALITVAIGARMTSYVVDVFWGLYSNAQVCEEMIRWQQMPEAIRPKIVGMGRSAWELQLEQYCRERCKELNVSIPFQFITTVENNEAKNDHIRRLTPFVENRKIKVLKGCANRAQLLHEFDWFPKSKQKDCIDALAHIAKIALPGRERDFLEESPRAEQDNAPRGLTFNDLMKQVENNKVRIGSHQRIRNRIGSIRMR